LRIEDGALFPPGVLEAKSLLVAVCNNSIYLRRGLGAKAASMARAALKRDGSFSQSLAGRGEWQLK